MIKTTLLLTFDYELPLGGIAKSFEHSLFDPAHTGQVIGSFKKAECSGGFFC